MTSHGPIAEYSKIRRLFICLNLYLYNARHYKIYSLRFVVRDYYFRALFNNNIIFFKCFLKKLPLNATFSLNTNILNFMFLGIFNKFLNSNSLYKCLDYIYKGLGNVITDFKIFSVYMKTVYYLKTERRFFLYSDFTMFKHLLMRFPLDLIRTVNFIIRKNNLQIISNFANSVLFINYFISFDFLNFYNKFSYKIVVEKKLNNFFFNLLYITFSNMSRKTLFMYGLSLDRAPKLRRLLPRSNKSIHNFYSRISYLFYRCKIVNLNIVFDFFIWRMLYVNHSLLNNEFTLRSNCIFDSIYYNRFLSLYMSFQQFVGKN